MKNLAFFLVISCVLFSACSKEYLPYSTYDAAASGKAPNYADLYYWAAHPDKKDTADRTPSGLTDNQASAEVDVFFLHPTIYTRSYKGTKAWNGDLNDEKLNEEVDKTTILSQASIFNGAGRVFAPRYRQAHIQSYFTSDTTSAKAAFALAYEDLKMAFLHYLEFYNEGRPFIIASHSQGTTHAAPLMRELIDGKALQNQLVAAYLVGMPIPRDYFKEIIPCESAEDTGCFCSWRTWKRTYTPRKETATNTLVTNPLTWKTNEEYAPKELNKGAVLYRFNKILPQAADAQINDQILWASKPKFFGAVFMQYKNYHIGDYNLFYVNVRENAILRAKQFLAEEQVSKD